MYSENPFSFTGTNTSSCFIHAFMDGIILKDIPYKVEGVCSKAGTRRTKKRADGTEPEVYFPTVTETIEAYENGDNQRNQGCNCETSEKRTFCVHDKRSTGSRTNKLLRCFRLFRSLEWRLVLFSFMLLIHGIG